MFYHIWADSGSVASPRKGSRLKHLIHMDLIKIKLRSFKSSEHINEKSHGPYCGSGYLSLFSDPLDLAKWSQREILQF